MELGTVMLIIVFLVCLGISKMGNFAGKVIEESSPDSAVTKAIQKTRTEAETASQNCIVVAGVLLLFFVVLIITSAS